MADEISSNPEGVIEELKIVVEERRFVITRYMQAMAFYIALVAFGGGQYFQAPGKPEKLFILLLMFTINTLAWLGAKQFRAMAYHALDRETLLAPEVHFQGPYPLIWGYKYALAMGAIVQLGVLAAIAHLLFI